MGADARENSRLFADAGSLSTRRGVVSAKRLIFCTRPLAPGLRTGSTMASEGPKGDPRWRVAILDDHERSRAALRAAIWAAGSEVVGEAVRCADALSLARRTSPNVAVCAIGLPDGDGIEMARQLIDAGCPVVLFTSHTRQELVDRARSAGVMSYLLKPLR